jgi:hypothetical protein
MTERTGTQPMEGWRGRLDAIRRVMGDVLYGMALHDMVRSNLRQRASLEHLFILITFGDLVGVPILPPYYCMRLLPFIVPEIHGWRRRLLRERDLVDSLF